MDGAAVIYNCDGSKLFEGIYSGNEKHGEGIEYYPNGKIMVFGSYYKGFKHGIVKEFDENEQLTEYRYYKGEKCTFDPDLPEIDDCTCELCQKLRKEEENLKKIEEYTGYLKDNIEIAKKNRIDWNPVLIEVNSLNLDAESSQDVEEDFDQYEDEEPSGYDRSDYSDEDLESDSDEDLEFDSDEDLEFDSDEDLEFDSDDI